MATRTATVTPADTARTAANSQNGAGSYDASASTQYTPRYRELTSGSQSDANDRYADSGRQSARPPSSEWPPRSDDRR
jgi:hypothetical protein